MQNITAFPLQWPPEQPRSTSPRISPFKKKSFDLSRRSLTDELKRLGARDVILSTNIPLRQDGHPYANAARPKDHGVAVYFKYKGRSMVFACDRWCQIECNMHSIELTISAIRGIERWGSSDMMEKAFTGFAALEAPGPKKRPWWYVLELETPPRSRIVAREAYLQRLKRVHPDHGGTHEAMVELNQAWEEAQTVTV
jgi:hypothetical protein